MKYYTVYHAITYNEEFVKSTASIRKWQCPVLDSGGMGIVGFMLYNKKDVYSYLAKLRKYKIKIYERTKSGYREIP